MKLCLKCKEVFGFSNQNYCSKCGGLLLPDTKENLKKFSKEKLVLSEILDFFFDNHNTFIIDIDLTLMNVEILQNEIKITLKEKEKK